MKNGSFSKTYAEVLYNDLDFNQIFSIIFLANFLSGVLYLFYLRVSYLRNFYGKIVIDVPT